MKEEETVATARYNANETMRWIGSNALDDCTGDRERTMQQITELVTAHQTTDGAHNDYLLATDAYMLGYLTAKERDEDSLLTMISCLNDEQKAELTGFILGRYYR